MKNYTKEKFSELLRKTDFPDYTDFTCLNKAYQDFIFKFSEMIDLLCPSKKLRFKANSKPWIDSETISAIHRREKLFIQKIQKIGFRNRQRSFLIGKNGSSESKSKKKKRKPSFQEKIEKNANNSKKVWKALFSS